MHRSLSLPIHLLVLSFVPASTWSQAAPAGPQQASVAAPDHRQAQDASAPALQASTQPGSPEATTVDVLVDEILTRNPEVRFYEAEIEAARAGRRGAGALTDPELSVEAGRKRSRDLAGTLSGEGTAWSVSVSQTFEWPGRLALRKSIANRQIELSELGLQRFRSALQARARVLASGLYAAATKAEATREVAERYQALREVFVARDPAGITPLLETRIVEAQELSLRRRASETEIAHRAAVRELNALRGAPLDAPFAVVPPALTFPTPPDEARLIASALEHNFDYRIRRIELEQQVAQVSLARNERYPAVTVSPFYSREKAGETETTLGVGLSVPLPLSQKTRSGVDVAAARRRQAETALAVAQRELERAVLDASATYRVKLAEIESWSHDAVQKFREAAALADRHYRLGAVPLDTYIELQSAYLEAVEALLDTQREALEARLRIEELSGEPLATGAKP